MAIKYKNYGQQQEVIVISPDSIGPDNTTTAGGIGTHVYELYSELSSNMKNRILLLTSNESDSPQGVATVKLPLINKRFLKLLSFHLLSTYYLLYNWKRIKPKAVHVHYSEMSLIPAILTVFIRIKLIVTLHGYWDLKKFPKFLRPFMWFTWFFIKKINAELIVLSKDSYDYHRKICQNNSIKISIVPNGSINSKLIYTNSKIPKVRGSKTIIIFSGRLSAEKNVENLLKAFNGINNRDLELWIVGDGPERDKLEDVVSRLEMRSNIRFWGWLPRSEVFNLLRRADIFVLPSIYEGMPIAMLEAYAMGLKCICIRNSFTETMPNVLLLESQTVHEIKHKILIGISNYFQPDPEFINKMSWNNAAKALESIYFL